MAFVTVAYYTRATPYAQEVNNLIKSLKKFDMHYEIGDYKARKDWKANTEIRQGFIARMLDKYQEDILYVDADAIICQYPVLFDEFNGDFGAHYKDDKELLGGTMFFTNNQRVRDFVDYWIDVQTNTPHQILRSQHLLQHLLVQDKTLKVTRLPPEYTQIFDLMKNRGGAPVIKHMQASRRFKNIVRRK